MTLGIWRVLAYIVMGGTVPFVLARSAPQTAGFDTTWFPAARSHWLWFAGMAFIVFLCTLATAMLVRTFGIRDAYHLYLVFPTVWGVIVAGIAAIVIDPMAEEIFCAVIFSSSYGN